MRLLASFCLLMLPLAVCSRATLGNELEAALRVMSFNIRYGSAKDGENHWDHRKEFLVETIRKFDPDLLGTQETEKFQKEFLAAQLPGYTVLGVGRDDGADRGEMMAVFYRTDRFEKLESGHFWLSETPDVIGSKSWDSSLPRMVTWLKLRDKQAPGQPVIWFYNTHFDHRGEQARAEAGRLLHEKIAALPEGSPAIVTGDFNSAEGSPAYQNLFSLHQGRPLLQDAYRLVHPEKSDEERTFNDFKPESRKGARIDWIGVTPALKVERVEINRVSRNGRVPSDHFPIESVLHYKTKQVMEQDGSPHLMRSGEPFHDPGHL